MYSVTVYSTLKDTFSTFGPFDTKEKATVIFHKLIGEVSRQYKDSLISTHKNGIVYIGPTVIAMSMLKTYSNPPNQIS